MLRWGRSVRSGGFCCQVPPNPAWKVLANQGFSFGTQAALRSLGHRSVVVVGNYANGPITAEPCRAKAQLLHPRRSCFAPAATHPTLGFWWRRRVLPPGPKGLLRRPFIAIAGLRQHMKYRCRSSSKQRPRQVLRLRKRTGAPWTPVYCPALSCGSAADAVHVQDAAVAGVDCHA